jgi:hypothetical protein
MVYKFEWPLCAKCKRGVEKVERRQDFFTGDLIYTVICHGEQQTQIVTGLDLHDVTVIQTTSAFDEKPVTTYPSVTFKRNNEQTPGLS